MPELRPQPLAILLAVAIPIAIAVGWLLPLSIEQTRESSGLGTAELQSRLAPDADVIVIGNSLAQFGVDANALGAQIGKPGSVAKIWHPGAAPPTWYAALKNGVFAKGDTPELIVVVNTMRTMLTVDVGEAHHMADLRSLLTDDEPVIDAKVFNQLALDTPWARTLARRSGPRDLLINSFKRIPYTTHEDPLGRANEALDRVFGGQNISNANDRKRVIPIVEVQQDQQLRIPETTKRPEDSLMPDLVDLAHANGAKIVFVRVPIPRSGREFFPLSTLSEDRAAVEMLNEMGAGYIDLHDLPLPESAFVDDHHLGISGQRVFTTELAKALIDIGAMANGAMKPAETPRSFHPMVRSGRPPEITTGIIKASGCSAFIPIKEPWMGLADTRLEYLGKGPASPLIAYFKGKPLAPSGHPVTTETCSGTSYHDTRGIHADSPATSVPEEWSVALSNEIPLAGEKEAYWVYPGTSVEMKFDGSEVGPSRVGVVALNATQGAGVPKLTVAGKDVPLIKYGIRWVGISDAVPTRKKWELSLSTPEDGPFLLLSMLALRNGPDASFLIGGPDDMTSSLRFLTMSTVEITYDEPAKLIAAVEPVIESTQLPYIPVDGYAAVASDALIKWARAHETGIEVPNARTMASCSPLQLWEDGVPMPQVEQPQRLRQVEESSYASMGDRLYFRTSDGKPADHVYKAALRRKRWCRKHLSWLYPGDRASMALIEAGRLHGGAAEIVVSGFVFGDPEALIGVKMLRGDEVILDTKIRAGDLERESNLKLPLVPRLQPAPKDLRLEWSVPPDGPFILLHIGVLNA